MCEPVIHSLLECIGGSREEVGGVGSPLFVGAERARTWAAGVAERANQAPGMRSVGVRTGGQVEEGDEGGEEEKLNGKFARRRVGVDCGARARRARPSAACGPTSGTAAELSSAIRDAASLFAFIFRFASSGEAERHDVTY